MAQLHQYVNRLAYPGLSSSTRFVRITGRTPNNNYAPIVSLHGWPQSASWSAYLNGEKNGGSNALYASGFTVFAPFTGSNWGHATDIYPTGTGGTGTTAVDDTLTAASAAGYDTSEVYIYGASMGGLNALNWAWRNPSKVKAIYLLAPMVDIMGTYDTSAAASLGVTTSLLQVYGAANRAELDANCQSNDPVRNTGSLTSLGSKIKVFGTVDDEVIPIASLTSFCNTIGAELNTTTGSHFFFNVSPGYSEYEAPAWFQANP